MPRKVRKMLRRVRDRERVMWFLLKVTGPTWKCEKTEARINPGLVKQVTTKLLLSVKRRTKIERKMTGKIFTKSQARTGIQEVLRIPDISPQ